MERRFERVESDIEVLKADVSVLKADVSVLKADVSVLKADVSELKADVSVLKADVSVLKTDVKGLKTEVVDLRRHMGVLHEDLVDRIKGIREDDSLRVEMRAGFAQMRQMFLDHTIPGDAADRQFAATLGDHERRIQTLEGQ